MKVLAWIFGLLIVVFGVIYFIVFTATGNSIIRPIIEDKINEVTKLNTTLSTFKLTINDFEIFLELDSDNTIHAKGSFELFAQSFDALYEIKLNKLEKLNTLTKANLFGSLRTNGTAIGDVKFITIDGISDVAESNTFYHVELTELNPSSIIATMKNANLKTLLKLGGQAPYAIAKLDVNINFKNITPHQLDGDIVLVTKNGVLNTKFLNKELNLNIPKTKFSMNLDAVLKGDAIDYTYKLHSNLAKLTSSGKVIPVPLALDIKYGVNIKELALLKPITNADIRGAFKLNGTVKGIKESMIVKGSSDVASSTTTFTAGLKDFAPESLQANMKNLQLSRVFYMLKEPHYADGIFDLDIDMTNLKSGELKGYVTSHIKKGLLDSVYLTKSQSFKTRMPRTTFTLETKTSLKGDIVDTFVNLDSSLLNLDVKQARMNLADGSILSDYTTTIPNLNKLYFVIERHLKGSLKATGEFKKKDEDTIITMHSTVSGGKLDIKIHNDILRADLKSIQTIDAMKMLLYPPVFKSSLNGVLEYNTLKRKGKFNGSLVDGGFEENMAFTLMKQYAGIDMYKENFQGDVSADINQDIVLASFDLKSNTSSIKTVNTKINSHTNRIDSEIEIIANNHPIIVKLKGHKSRPNVSIDAESLIREQAKKEIKKQLEGKVGQEITRRLEEKIGKEASEQLGDFLNGFF